MYCYETLQMLVDSSSDNLQQRHDNNNTEPHLVDESIEHLDRRVGGCGVVQPVPGEGSQVAELVRKPRHLASSGVRG